MNSGYYEEAKDWRAWLLRAMAGDPSQMQTMYGIAGERRLTEWEIPWLDGYEGAKPVRIGNAASEQLQLDIYGESDGCDASGADRKYRHGRVGLGGAAASIEHFETIWDQPDSGIWEVRGDPRQFTYSKVMAWVAFDRAVKTIEEFDLEGPLEEWRAIRAKIHDEVCREAFD